MTLAFLHIVPHGSLDIIRMVLQLMSAHLEHAIIHLLQRITTTISIPILVLNVLKAISTSARRTALTDIKYSI